jgi:16S rRNA processing protein RimM
MIDRNNCYLFGTLLKLHGFDGEMVMKSRTTVLPKLKKSEPVFLDIEGILVPFFVSTIDQISGDACLISFDDVSSDQKARELVGCNIYSSVPAKENIQTGIKVLDELIGYQLIDQKLGLIGTIIDCIDISQNPLFQVQGKDGEFLVPANQDLILDISADSRQVNMDLPDGLLGI